ncbi:MAG TPA: 30S ribosome-binding factor RbfA [Chloroflexota bacterium]|nr:30S ribosome-binding factor RbfA [Chloroflexota bacterium]
MPTRRIARLNEQVRADLAELITREMKDPRLAGLVSVTAADLTPDLRHAHVFISVLGSEEERKKTFQAIQNAAGFLRTQLAARMTTKRAPELHFALDASIERGQRIMQLLHEVDLPEPEPERPREP